MYEYFWFLIGIGFVVLEVVMGMTIVLFFAALSAFCIGFLIYFGLLDPANLVAQTSLFFVIMLIWATLLWKKLKYFRDNIKPNEEYKNIEGQHATIINEDLVKGKIGTAKWSGTTVKVELDQSSIHKSIKLDDDVIVISVKNNIFIVGKK